MILRVAAWHQLDKTREHHGHQAGLSRHAIREYTENVFRTRNVNSCASRACRYLLPLGLAVRLVAQPDPSELLLRVRDRVANTLDRLPRYMYTQTIDRSEYQPYPSDLDVKACDDRRAAKAEQRLVRTNADRVRLDVGIAEQREIYSWVGENRFENRSLFSIVSEGSLSKGDFEGFLELIFREDNASFSYSGEISEGGRGLAEYTYRVPLETSHYVFQSPGRRAVTAAYEGTLLVDPQTAELVSLTLRTTAMPPATGACEVTHTMSYGHFRLNGSGFLLPSETRMHITELNGVETENLTAYSGCHEFRGESTLNFETPPDTPEQTPSPPRAEMIIPAMLPLRLALAESINVATAAAGDTVKAVLTADLRDRMKVLIPKGTPVSCRILRIRRRYYRGTPSRVMNFHDYSDDIFTTAPGTHVELLLGLENFLLPAGQRPVYARLNQSSPRAPAPGRHPGELRPLNAMPRNQWFVTFNHGGDQYVIKSGLASKWVTVTR